MIRRSRGYAPLPMLLSAEKKREGQKGSAEADKSPDALTKINCVLAVGGELKNTFCIASGDLFYLSPYVGDLEDLRTVRALKETIGRMETLLEVTPAAVVCDLHPKYNATAVAEEIAEERKIPLLRIQHHYAHILSCMAENDRSEAVIGVSFDGTGYGTDGTIWGGEILTADYHDFCREYSIAPFTQIGGDSAPRQGWRIAASMIWNYCRSDRYYSIMEELAVCDQQNAKVQRLMAERRMQAVTSTSAGRLFDGVSAMLGICRESTYEGEASIELEFAAERYAAKLAEDEIPAPESADRPPVCRASGEAPRRRRPRKAGLVFPRISRGTCSRGLCPDPGAKRHRHGCPYRRLLPEPPSPDPDRGRAQRQGLPGPDPPSGASQRRRDRTRTGGSRHDEIPELTRQGRFPPRYFEMANGPEKRLNKGLE